MCVCACACVCVRVCVCVCVCVCELVVGPHLLPAVLLCEQAISGLPVLLSIVSRVQRPIL